MVITETASNIEIEKKEILRYLGYGNNPATPEILKKIDNSIKEMQAVASYKACYDKFAIERSDDTLSFGNVTTTSKSLGKNLKECDEVVVFTATIGIETDRIIQRHNMMSPSDAVIAQAVGATQIEAWCDFLCEHFEKKYKKAQRPRFSAGYGDLPLEKQKDIFDMLDCPRKIGVSLTQSLMMVPTKSVSAIVGLIGDNVNENFRKA